MSTIIIPTVGRVVWLWPASNVAAFPGQPHAALIAGVIDDNTINVMAADCYGNPYAVREVPLIQGDMMSPSERFATWMPYQVGQAAKQAADVSALIAQIEAMAARFEALESAVGTMDRAVDMLDDDVGNLAATVASMNTPAVPATGDPVATPEADKGPATPEPSAAQASETTATPGQPDAGAGSEGAPTASPGA